MRVFGFAGRILTGLMVFFLLIPGSAWSQQQKERKDTTIILISSIQVQIETNEALNDLYNFKFEEAEKQFRWLMQKYRWHPLPYFLIGLGEWWKIMPDTKNTDHDDRFLAYMDSAIMVARNLHKKYPEYRIEAAFFLSAAHGFKGRLYSDEERQSWRKAAFEGKAALDYLEECKEKNYLSPELLFGDALYNYFSVWVPENYSALKPIMWFFPKGDKALGLKQLKEVSFNAFYTRVEAMVWLMRIWNSYENEPMRAFQLAEYLHQTFPDNPYFHRYFARTLYSRGMFTDLEGVAKDIISKIDSGKVGYEATSGRYAAFYLGQIYDVRKKYEDAKTYYKLTMKYSESNKATEAGYYLYSMIALGEIASKQGNKKEAEYYFKEVKKRSDRKDEAYKDAKRRLRDLEKGD